MNVIKIATTTLVALVLASGCKHKETSAMAMQRPPTPVAVVPAIAQSVPVYIDQIGKTAARESVTIQPQVGGKIMQIHFTDGANLKKGDPLFTIDPRPYEAALHEKEATVAQTQADVLWAQSELKRVQGLAGTGAVSTQDVESKQNAVAVADAKVHAAAAAVETAKLNLEYCTINSPIEGRAGQRLVDTGNVVNTGGPDGGTKLLTIQRVEPIYADFIIAEQDLPRVRQQMTKGALKTQVWLPEEPATTAHDGELTFLDNAVTSDAGTIKLRATLPNKDAHFWPGQFVKVRLVLDTIQNAVLVPSSAQQIGQQGPFVYVAHEGESVDQMTQAKLKGMIAELRVIKPGQRQGDMLVILDGVKAGEQVVTEGQMMLRPGALVQITPAAGAPAPSPTTKPAAVADGASKS